MSDKNPFGAFSVSLEAMAMAAKSLCADQSFSAYALAFDDSIKPPEDPGSLSPHVAAAILIGSDARGASDEPLTRAGVAVAVGKMLSDDPPASTRTADHDPTADRLAGYADGERDTLTDLAAIIPALDESSVVVLRGWIDNRLSALSKPGALAKEDHR